MLSHADAADTIAARMVRAVGSSLPTGFNGDGELFGLNLFLMTAFMCLGALMAGRMARALWVNRRCDALRHPVTIWRIAWLLAGAAAFLRCGAEAINLWAWNPVDVRTTARVLMAKRWIDPVALLLAAGWMVLVTLSDAGMTKQLTKRPYPVKFWASLPSLRRPLAIALLSLIAAVGVTVTR